MFRRQTDCILSVPTIGICQAYDQQTTQNPAFRRRKERRLSYFRAAAQSRHSRLTAPAAGQSYGADIARVALHEKRRHADARMQKHVHARMIKIGSQQAMFGQKAFAAISVAGANTHACRVWAALPVKGHVARSQMRMNSSSGAFRGRYLPTAGNS
jgi:hypothetical protein